MYFRGRVIRRQPVSCYAVPQSIQEQKRKFKELATLFRASFCRNVIGYTKQMPDLLGPLGLLGPFPYPDLLTGEAATDFPAASTVWLRVLRQGTFTANFALAIAPEHGIVKRAIAVVDKNGAKPKLTKLTYLKELQDLGEQVDLWGNETAIANGRQLVFAASTGNAPASTATPHDRAIIDLAEGSIEIYMVLYCTRSDMVEGLGNNFMSYCALIDVDQWMSGSI